MSNEQRNVEIKARLISEEDFIKCVEIARNLSKSDGEIIKQRDIFYQSQQGRLKLRYHTPPKLAELIYYERSNEQGPKLSTYTKMNVEKPELLEIILKQSNGQQGVLVKKCLLFLHENRIRIHLDKVDNLGTFIEFEICLKPDESLREGQTLAEQLMEEFNIKPEHLMKGSYFEELNKNI